MSVLACDRASDDVAGKDGREKSDREESESRRGRATRAGALQVTVCDLSVMVSVAMAAGWLTGWYFMRPSQLPLPL